MLIGASAFTMIMAVTTWLSYWWMTGKLPKFIQEQKDKNTNEGKIVHIVWWRFSFSFILNRTFWVRLAFLILGPSAVIGLSIAYAQILPLRVVFVIYVLPAYLIMAALGIIYPEWGKRAAIGFTAGILATIIYDVLRLALAVSLGLPDPIPHIGVLWLGAETIVQGDMWWVGYLWRFFGNGAGLGIAFAMLPKWWLSLKGGWLYGDFVGLGMFAVLFFFPIAQAHLFILNFTVLVNGILGHWAYGLAIGWLFSKFRLRDGFPDHEVHEEKPLTWRK